MPDETLLNPKTQGSNLILIIGIVVGAAAAIFRGLVWSQGRINGQSAGYAIGGMLVQAGIAYLFAGRRKVRSSVRFGLIFMISGIVILLLELSAHSSTH